MVEVGLWGALIPLAGNQPRVQVEARDIRELLRKLVEAHPGLQEPFDEGVAVVIDGTVYRDDWSRTLPDGAEVFVMRRLAGG